jgi:hypothetical protein
MKVRAMFYPITLLFLATGILHPQDSHYRPESQQIRRRTASKWEPLGKADRWYALRMNTRFG